MPMKVVMTSSTKMVKRGGANQEINMVPWLLSGPNRLSQFLAIHLIRGRLLVSREPSTLAHVID